MDGCRIAVAILPKASFRIATGAMAPLALGFSTPALLAAQSPVLQRAASC
jgi:hypothetical protein